MKSRERKKGAEALMEPQWFALQSSFWETRITSKFHQCVHELPDKALKNLAFNTLIKLAQPSRNDLAMLPREDKDKPWWQMTSLKNYENILGVVWCAKDVGTGQVIEAHFVASPDKCLHFQQTHPLLPKGAVSPLKDLSGIVRADTAVKQSRNIKPSWTLTQSIGNSTLDERISELPEVSSYYLIEFIFNCQTLYSCHTANPIDFKSPPSQSYALNWINLKKKRCIVRYLLCSSQGRELER